MNENSKAIITLCSHIGASSEIKPLEPKEYSEIALTLKQKGLTPANFFDSSAEEIAEMLSATGGKANRIFRLMERSPSLAFEIEKYENMGINIVTRADKNYPGRLKVKLGAKCPPLFYTAGNLELCNNISIGFAGSRNINDKDFEFTRLIARKTVQRGYTVVSGGAKGVDQVAVMEALECGGNAIAYISDSMIRKLRDVMWVKAIQEGRLVVLSAVKPDAGFNAGTAMMRNKYIYTQSIGTVVVKSDIEKGGTWAGAVENLRNQWSRTYCYDNNRYKGNKELIRKGAVPIGEKWDVNVECMERKEEPEQISFFG